MGFFSFGKKKKNEAPPPPPATRSNRLARPSNAVNSASATSSLSIASSGSSSGYPTQPPLPSHTFSASQDRPQRSLSFSPQSMIPPVPRRPGSATPSASHSRTGSSTSLNGPIAPYANRDLQKKGSTNTLNSMRSTVSNGKRGAHDAPRVAPELAALAKPRAYSYHASQVRNIWVTAASDAGHSTVQVHNTGGGNAKYHSTGSPGLMNRGSSYFNGMRHSSSRFTYIIHMLIIFLSPLPFYFRLLLPTEFIPTFSDLDCPKAAQQTPQQHPTTTASDAEFKIYAKKYDTAIARAHTLAREYHHLPPAKRDRPRFEQIGRAFAAAAQISREQWSRRCRLEKERLEVLLASKGASAQLQEEDVMAESVHRVAGMRATEGWQYASMLADAWGVKEEVNTPLEDMPVLKPKYPTYHQSSSSPSAAYYYGGGDRGGGGRSYVHPGYTQSGYNSYITSQPTTAPASTSEFGRSKHDTNPPRDRMDSTASATPSLESYAHSSSSHTHSGMSHGLPRSKSHQALSTPLASSLPLPSAATAAKASAPAPKPAPAPVPVPAIAAGVTSSGSYSSTPSYLPSPLKATTATKLSSLPPPAARARAPASSVVEQPAVRAPIVLTKGRRYRERGGPLTGAAVAAA